MLFQGVLGKDEGSLQGKASALYSQSPERPLPLCIQLPGSSVSQQKAGQLVKTKQNKRKRNKTKKTKKPHGQILSFSTRSIVNYMIQH